MKPAPNVVAGILLMLSVGSCADGRENGDNQIEPEVWSVVTFTIPGEEPILLPEEGLIGLDLVRITTLGGRQILLSHARVLGESIHGEVPGDSIRLPEVVVPFDSVAMIESRASVVPDRLGWWLKFGMYFTLGFGFLLILIAKRREWMEKHPQDAGK